MTQAKFFNTSIHAFHEVAVNKFLSSGIKVVDTVTVDDGQQLIIFYEQPDKDTFDKIKEVTAMPDNMMYGNKNAIARLEADLKELASLREIDKEGSKTINELLYQVDELNRRLRAYRELKVETRCYSPSLIATDPVVIRPTESYYSFAFASAYGAVYCKDRGALVEIQAKLFRLEKLEDFYRCYKEINGDT